MQTLRATERTSSDKNVFFRQPKNRGLVIGPKVSELRAPDFPSFRVTALFQGRHQRAPARPLCQVCEKRNPQSAQTRSVHPEPRALAGA